MTADSMLICAVVLSLGLGAMATEKPPLPRDAAGKVVYQAVVAVDGVSAAELHARARAWVAHAYKSAQAVVQLDDAATGQLVIKGISTATWKLGWVARDDLFRHTLTIEFKDGRYRYTLTDLVRVTVDRGSPEVPVEADLDHRGDSKVTIKMYTALADSISALLDSLNAAMEKPTPATDKSW